MSRQVHILVLGATLALALGLAGCGAQPGAVTASAPTSAAPSTTTPFLDPSPGLEQVEDQYGVRIGVSVYDEGSGQSFSYRGDERFGFASTLKVLLAAAFLQSTPPEARDSVVVWTQEDVESAGYSPATSEHVADGLTLAQLAEAAVRSSDNTAANILFEELGGPAGAQDALRGLGDRTTSVVDVEPELNVIEPGSIDDTTTPHAFTSDLREVLLGEALSARDRATLIDWMSGNATGDHLIRAGAPEGWVVADKSGGAGGIRNDVALVTPPGRPPLVISVLTEKTDPGADYEDEAVARAAQAALAAFAGDS